MDLQGLISKRARSLDASGIRRAFERSARLFDPINLSIGQPDFEVAAPMREAVKAAIDNGQNGYTMTQGADAPTALLAAHLRSDIGWEIPSETTELILTSGTTGAISLAFMALLDEGDEAIMPDPYFVIYPALAEMMGGKPVYVDTYPDFRMTADRVEPLITDRTKLVIVNSPGNPSGVVLSEAELIDLEELCRAHNLVLISDEIYDAFTFSDGLENGRFPTPAHRTQEMLLIRGMGKTYGCTGWRLGYAAGPKVLIDEMAKLQQYTFVCTPSIVQASISAIGSVDLAPFITAYEKKRDMVVEALSSVTNLTHPSGAFYAFVEVPPELGETATEFTDRAMAENVIVIPGHIFSHRDTHFRISFAIDDERLAQGLEILRRLMLKR
ncbi:MAG: pyridoxal phosphate-dependent aminotransferase [Phycisphaerales bacterium]|nr:pyridoxal phosphate-dependent aminotransferase [Phycisphaerales bacterium]